MNDKLLAKKGIDVLVENLGKVETERFITLILREPFDYTEWQSDLFSGMSGDELYEATVEYSDAT